MRKYFLPLGAAAIAAAAFIGLIPLSMGATETGGQRHVIEIRKFEYRPQELEVAPGDTVVWINYDLIPHTATAEDANWDSETIEAKKEWQIVVREGMSELYLCLFHPTMRGRLKIVRR